MNSVDIAQTVAISVTSSVAVVAFFMAQRERRIGIEASALERIADRIADVALEAERARWQPDKRDFKAARSRLLAALYFTRFELPVTERLIEEDDEDHVSSTGAAAASHEIAEALEWARAWRRCRALKRGCVSVLGAPRRRWHRWRGRRRRGDPDDLVRA